MSDIETGVIHTGDAFDVLLDSACVDGGLEPLGSDVVVAVPPRAEVVGTVQRECVDRWRVKVVDERLDVGGQGERHAKSSRLLSGRS